MTIEKTSTFYDPGFLKVEKRIIKNHNKTKPQYINLLELFKQSSNVAAAQVALSMKPEDFYNSIKRFMIGSARKKCPVSWRMSSIVSTASIFWSGRWKIMSN